MPTNLYLNNLKYIIYFTHDTRKGYSFFSERMSILDRLWPGFEPVVLPVRRWPVSSGSSRPNLIQTSVYLDLLM
ncbi:hypothetical protein M378DRAFT_173736 [Amanita muscaria Koide BX008]|uniref:Uncharacterized protein n=1 Tax=Amanita muscaria (strain Koide BX008) TaxID=946122 RepID=A0A0C2SMT9_AMAMK|nr:hypothetical protein M378DRAFT_173736 [Amanita muscaria Koide BX008]